MGRPRDLPVIRADRESARYAERIGRGWQWLSVHGTTYTLQYLRPTARHPVGVWVASWSRPGESATVVRAASATAAMAGWQLEPRAVFRRTLRPHGLT